MLKENYKLREFAKANKVPLWRIADNLGISEQTLIRRLRKQLDTETEKQIEKIIVKIAGEQNAV